jgi:hypothetical protein
MGTKMLQTPAAKRPDVEKKLEDMTSNYKHFFPALHVRIRAARGAAGMTPKSVSQSILLLCTPFQTALRVCSLREKYVKSYCSIFVVI